MRSWKRPCGGKRDGMQKDKNGSNWTARDSQVVGVRLRQGLGLGTGAKWGCPCKRGHPGLRQGPIISYCGTWDGPSAGRLDKAAHCFCLLLGSNKENWCCMFSTQTAIIQVSLRWKANLKQQPLASSIHLPHLSAVLPFVHELRLLIGPGLQALRQRPLDAEVENCQNLTRQRQQQSYLSFSALCNPRTLDDLRCGEHRANQSRTV